MDTSINVLLAPGGRTKLIKFIAEAIVDREHPDVAFVIDSKRMSVTISNHISAEGNTYLSYEWDILKVDADVYRELAIPAKGFSNILEKLDSTRSILLSVSARNVITIANFEDTKPQLSLFDHTEINLADRNLRVVHHSIEAKASVYLGGYTLELKPARAKFQLRVGQLAQQLALITNLRKEKGNESSQHQFVISLSPQKGGKCEFTVTATRNHWFCLLSCEVDLEIADGIEVGISISRLSIMSGLLSRVNGDITVEFRDNHVIFSKDKWLCSFITDHVKKDHRVLSSDVRNMSLDEFFPVPKINLLDFLPKINTADDNKQGRLKLVCHSSDLLNLCVKQDKTESGVTIPMAFPIFERNDALSLSLWALKTLLGYFPSKLLWKYDRQRARIIFTDEMRSNHIVLQVKNDHR